MSILRPDKMVLLNIPEWFSGKNVFITGGSGFIGRVLIEKLLRSCPNIGTIYMLLRPLKGNDVNERIHQVFDIALFENLKCENPKAISKIVPIEGDVTQLGLGINAKDRKTLIENVNVIFNAAASVRFDDSLKDAIFINTRSTREVVNLGLEMENLKVLVHISTTYCHVDRKVVDEVLYPAQVDWRDAIRIAEEMDPHILNIFTAKYIEPMPNTYTFAKKLAEEVVNDLCDGKIPSIIIRPSIVIPTILEPIKGWVDNFHGPVGLVIGIGKGILKVSFTNANISLDIIPVDIVVKAILVSTWKKGIESENFFNKSLSVYNVSNNKTNTLTIDEITKIGIRKMWEVPIQNILWFPSVNFTTWEVNYYLQVIFRHVFLAIVFDEFLKLVNMKPMLLKLQRRIYVANMALQFFMMNEWTFINEKLFNLRLHPNDIKDFEYVQCLRNANQQEYFHYAILGGRQHLLKEDITSASLAHRAKIVTYGMWWLAKIVDALLLLVLWWLLFYKLDIIGYLQEKCSNYFSDW